MFAIGHTEAVEMEHYRQTGKAAEKFYEQAAGAGKYFVEKNGAEMGVEHAKKPKVAAQGLEPRTRGL